MTVLDEIRTAALGALVDYVNDEDPPRDLEPVDRALYALAQTRTGGDPYRGLMLLTLNALWNVLYGPLENPRWEEIGGHIHVMYVDEPSVFVGPHEPGYWYFDDEHIEPPADVCFTCSNPETGLWVGLMMCDMINAEDYDWMLAAEYRRPVYNPTLTAYLQAREAANPKDAS